MENDLPGTNSPIFERSVPDRDQGRLIEAQQVSRYLWAAQAARGRTVLDAGCGTAYGSRLLADAGARQVVGVDIATAVLESVGAGMPASVLLQSGDLRKLELEDDGFELIVCFEVIEHVDDPFRVLDELARVLVPGGLLLISSPNVSVHQAGNPHHLHEFTPSNLKAALGARLSHVGLLRQDDYIVSALLSDDNAAKGEGSAIEDLALRKLSATAPGDETYTIAMASDAALPEMAEMAAMAGTVELREWLSVFEAQTAAITDRDNYIDELQTRLPDNDRLAELLVDAEGRLSQVPELHERIADLEFELSQARHAAEAARREARELDQMLMYGRRMLRYVRPAIKPLRKARKRLRG